MEGLNYEIKMEILPFENFKVEDIERIQVSTSKVVDFNISLKDDSIDRMFFDWVNQSLIEKDTVLDEVHVRTLTKPYPYKSKKKRLIKKWWDKHSEIKVYKNVKFDFGE